MKKSFIAILYLISIIPAMSQFSEDALRYSASGWGVGSRALGMGGAYIGVADDYTASFWNPAGLAQLRRLELTGGISNYGISNAASFQGSSSTVSSSATGLNNLGFVFPFPTVRGSLVLAFGFNRIAEYGASMQFNGFNAQSSIIPTLYDANGSYDIPFNVYLENTKGYTPIQKNVQQRGNVNEAGNLGLWSFAGAIDIEENISFGVSLNILNGNYSYTRKYVEEDVNNVYANSQSALPADSAYLRFNKFYYDNYVSSEVAGGSFTFSLMYRSEQFRVGVIARTPASITVHEAYTDEGLSVFDNTGTWQNNIGPKTSYSYEATNNYGVKSPWVLGGGASFYPLPMILLAADVEYTDWTQIAWKDNVTLEKGNTTLQSSFRAVTSYRIGTEIDIPSTDIRARFGYARSPSAYKNDPSSFDRSMITAGAGVLLQRNVLLDIALAFGNHKTYRNNYSFPGIPSASRTDESLSTTQFNFTVSYRF